MIRIPDKHLNDFLVSSLGYSGTDRWHPNDQTVAPATTSANGRKAPARNRMLDKGMALYQKLVGSGHVHLPFFLVLDLRMLTEYGYEFTYVTGDLDGFDSMLRSRYENQILNRLLREHRVQQALELLAFHRARQEDPTVDNVAFNIRADRLATILLEQLSPHWPQKHVVNAAHLRGRLLDLSDMEAVTTSAQSWRQRAEALGDDEGGFEALLESFVQSATGAHTGITPVLWHDAVAPQDIFELEHLEALSREYLRLGVRHIIGVMNALPALDPHDIELREEMSEVESQFMDDSYYPTGGFSEITNRGSFENLVLSELIYMGESAGLSADHERDIDLFDLRFVEGELLFYTRDSGQLFRKRRTLRLVLDMRRTLNIKYPQHPYQLGTMVAGMVLALVRDLMLLFANDALRFHVHILTGPKSEDADRLCETLSILLESPIQHGALEITVEQDLVLETLGAARRKTYAIIFTADPTMVDELGEDLTELRTASPPLFSTLIDLSPHAASRPAVPHVWRLEAQTGAIGDLKHRILLHIMGAHRQSAARHQDDDEA